MDPKYWKEQEAKANSHPFMSKSDDSYGPFMVSMCYFCGWNGMSTLCSF